MAIAQGPYTSNKNVVASYDMGDVKNSFLGEPTTNYIYNQNPRIDSSYATYNVGSHTNWLGMHPGAITVYSNTGVDISSYVNTGISVANSGVDWTQARHAYWVYDEELKKPVVQMYNSSSTWQAKSYGTGMNAWSSYGFTQGTQYTISWNQWVTNTSMRANVGMYTISGSGSYNFWDSLSYGSATSTNTKAHTWERVYHTYTVSNWNTSNSYSAIYMYGHDYGAGHVLRISDVQLEVKNHPTPYSNTLTRSNIYDNLRDLNGRSNAYYTDISYTAAAIPQPYFDGTNDYISTGLTSGTDMTNFSIECWFNATSISAYRNAFDMNYTTYATASVGNVGPRLEFNGSNINVIWSGNTGNNSLYNASSGVAVSANTWYHFVMTGAAGSMRFYLNGVLQTTSASAQGYRTNFSDISIGRGFCLDASRVFYGRIPYFRIYTKVLSDNEVYNNYVALRSRFT